MGSAASLPKDKGKFVARLRSVYERRTDETRPESLGDAGNTEHVLEGVKSEYEPRPVGSPPLKSIDEVAPPAGGVERGGFLGMGTTKAGNNNATQADGAGQLERRVEKGAGGGEQMGRSGIEDVGAENQEGNNYIGDRCKEKEEGEGGMEWMDEVDRGGRIALSFSDKPGCSNEKEGEGLLESPGVWSPVAAREVSLRYM